MAARRELAHRGPARGRGAPAQVDILVAALSLVGWAAAQATGPIGGPVDVTDAVRERHATLQLAVLVRAAELARAIEPLGVGFVRPVGGPISSPFGWRNISVAGNRFHGGIDIVADVGAPVVAARGGRVAFAGWSGAYGYVVYLDHEVGWQTRYAHLSRIDVRVGDVVRQGGAVGAIGSTGASTGPHLHFEVRFEGRALDPLLFVDR
jgi:murein DD-endopeptidase MepM/ murein hydrolase activator NlpD